MKPMTYVNYLARSGDHVFFGIAVDPRKAIETLAAANPQPVTLIDGWILPPKTRRATLVAIRDALREAETPSQGDWFEMSAASATELLKVVASAHGGKRWNLKTPIEPRPRRRPVVTPNGLFPSIAAAAEAHGMTRQAAWERVAKKYDDWHYA